MKRVKRWWNTPVEFYGVDRPEIQALPWHGLAIFVLLCLLLGLLWLTGCSVLFCSADFSEAWTRAQKELSSPSHRGPDKLGGTPYQLSSTFS